MLTHSVEFGGEYYEKIIRENGYDPSIFEGFTKDLSTIPREDLEYVFLCHRGLYDFSASSNNKAILTGFGLSGIPHMGTLAQINRIAMLNNAGFQTEVILGDLDAYNGKLTPLDRTRELAYRYEQFIKGTELLNPETSTVRAQYDHPDVLRTAYLIGRFANDELFETAEEDLHEFYAEKGKVDSKMSFRRKMSLNLMVADFFHLGQKNPDILVMLGLDEHQYVQVAQKLSSSIEAETSGIQPVSIHSLYTPLIRGLNGYPKMSKSFPDSGINLAMSKEAIMSSIKNEPDDFGDTEQSAIFQMACGVGLGNSISLSEAHAGAKDTDSVTWRKVKSALCSRIIMFSEIWHDTAANS